MKQKKIIVLVGPSGSGKTTIGNRLAEKGIPKLITTTTRPPRPGEVEGIDYYFKKKSEMQPQDFVEQTHYNGFIYGLSRKEVQDKLKHFDVVHVVMDQPGASAMKQFYPEETCVVFIGIKPEDFIDRLRARGESEEFIKERIAHSEENGELVPPPFTDYLIENNDLKTAVHDILKFAEK